MGRMTVCCLALHIFAIGGFTQSNVPFSEHLKLSRLSQRLYDRWCHPVPDRVFQLQQRLYRLLEQYPDDIPLLFMKAHLLAQQRRWHELENLLQDLLLRVRNERMDVRMKLFHLYWRRGAYLQALLQARPLLPWVWDQFSTIMGGFIVLSIGWILARRVKEPLLLCCAWGTIILALLAPVYNFIIGWIISGAPFPLHSFDRSISKLASHVLCWGTMLGIGLILSRSLPAQVSLLPPHMRRSAGIIVAIVVFTYLGLFLYRSAFIAHLFETWEHMNYLFIAYTLFKTTLGATAWGMFLTVGCYNSARKSLGIYGAIVWSSLIAVSLSLPWIRCLEDIPIVVGVVVGWLLLSIGMFEWRPSWKSAALPHIIGALIGELEGGQVRLWQL